MCKQVSNSVLKGFGLGGQILDLSLEGSGLFNIPAMHQHLQFGQQINNVC